VAITIESEPTDRAPVYSDLTYVVSTTNEAQANFRFIAVVKDGSGNIIAKLKAPILYNSTDKGVFNLSRILQNYVTYDFTLNTLQPTTCLNSYIAYSVEFGEEYGTTPAEYLNLASDTGKWAWNGLYSIFQSQTINDYLLDDAAAKFLTNVRTRRVSRTQYDYLYFLATADTKAIHVIAYDAAGRAGDVYALLSAALGTTDVTSTYKGIGISLADAGWTNKQLAAALLSTDVYKTDAGGVSDETFIKHVYKNVMGTDASYADTLGLLNWMHGNNFSQSDVLVTASELASFETTIGLTGLATTGIEYIPVV
jgi:hypothetical protein